MTRRTQAGPTKALDYTLVPQVKPGRFLLVELESGVHPRRVDAFMESWRMLPGVVSVTDLSVISQDTLDVILAKREPVRAPQRVQWDDQPTLFGEVA